MNKNTRKGFGWSGTLFAKEMRQNIGTILALCALLFLYLLGRGLAPYLFDKPSPPIALFPLLYWTVFAMAAVLGAAFLADENGTRTVNFLLRLPLQRKQIFARKIASHFAILFAGLVAALLAILLARSLATVVTVRIFKTLPSYCWSVPLLRWQAAKAAGIHSLYRDAYTTIVWIPLIYFLAVPFSIVLDRAITAFLAAAACAAIIYALFQTAGYFVADIFHLPSDPRFRLAHLVSNLLLTAVLAAVVALSWRLFARKEGR